MIDERTEELASAYALGVLDAEESAAFEARMSAAPELRRLVAELREATSLLAGASPALAPPAALRSKVLGALRPRSEPQGQGRPLPSWVPWALAAGLALAVVALGLSSTALRRQLLDARAEVATLNSLTVALRSESVDLHRTVAELQQSNRLATLRIALLSSQLRSAPRAEAVSVWDTTRQSGVFLVRGLAPPPSGKDYQLWIIDPRYRTPVDAGVFHVDAAGNARADFRAKLPIQNANQFAVTEESKGGSAVPTMAAMVLAGA